MTFFDYVVKQINFGEKYIKSKKSQIDQKHFETFDGFIKAAKN